MSVVSVLTTFIPRMRLMAPRFFILNFLFSTSTSAFVAASVFEILCLRDPMSSRSYVFGRLELNCVYLLRRDVCLGLTSILPYLAWMAESFVLTLRCYGDFPRPANLSFVIYCVTRCASSVYLLCILCASSVYPLCICCASSMHLLCIFCASSVHLLCIFCASSV